MARTGAKRPPNLEMWCDIAFPKAEIKVRALGLLGHYDHRTAPLRELAPVWRLPRPGDYAAFLSSSPDSFLSTSWQASNVIGLT